jgi:autotransporter-associated beta strand protein
MKKKPYSPCFATSVGVLAFAATVSAADLYYDLDPATADIDGGAGNWADANWKTTPGGPGGINWSANDSAFFNPIIGSPDATTITLGGPETATAVIFNGAGYTLTGGTLALAGTGASNWINMNADGAIESALGHLRFRGTGEATISGGGTISGRGILGDGGGNLVTVRQTAGTVTINDYLMVGGNNVADSQGHYIMDGGALTISQGIYLGWGGADRIGTFTQNGGTVTTQTGNQGIQLGIGGGKGYYNLNGGTLISNFGQFGSPYSGAFTFGGGTFQAATSFDTNRQTGVATTIADGATGRIDTGVHTVTWSTALTGAAANGLVKSGTGLLVLSGANSYAGDTTINAGTLRLGNASAAGNSSGTISANRTNSNDSNTKSSLDLRGYSLSNPITIGARNPGVGDAGALQNTLAGSTSVLDGSLQIGGENYGGGDGNITFQGLVSGAAAFGNSYSLFKQGGGVWKFENTANTFDGFYYQIGGTTEVTRLANLNEPSSLGQATTVTANRLSFGWNGGGGGTLRFVGDTPSTSDRVFVLQGATAAASNAIEAAGTTAGATLTLTGGISAGRAGSYKVALGGDHTGDNEHAGTIANGAGTVDLTKQGMGRWILSGANTYTGATTVSEGTLQLTHAMLADTAAVTVATGATLHLAFTGSPDVVGSLTLGDSVMGPGTYNATTHPGLLAGTGSIQIIGAANDYDDWAGPSGFDLAGGPDDDDDGDGLTNFDEYAFGLDPTDGASVSPVTAPDKAAGTFTYTRRLLLLTGLDCIYESSTNLADWDEFTPLSWTSDSGDPVETITVTLPDGLLAEGVLFLRVKAVQE